MKPIQFAYLTIGIAVAMALFFMPSMNKMKGNRSASTESVHFIVVDQGKFILRDENDSLNVIIIDNQNGVDRLINAYPFPPNMLRNVSLKWYRLIVVFSDFSRSVETDGVSRWKKIPDMLYIDLSESQTQSEYMTPPSGAKVSGYSILKIPRKQSVSTVIVREGRGTIQAIF